MILRHAGEEFMLLQSLEHCFCFECSAGTSLICVQTLQNSELVCILKVPIMKRKEKKLESLLEIYNTSAVICYLYISLK